MGDKFNLKNPAVKRILQEVREMQANPSDDFLSSPLEENIFEWQFAIRGAVGTEFEGGIFHGRIQLPAEYPFQPPAFLLLTPNGRFETQTKICLSISNHHPEHWQPSWSVRTALVALIAFMPTSPNGALGSLDYNKEERHTLALKSREASPKFGTPERQQLIDEIHEYMLSKAYPLVHHHVPEDQQIQKEEVGCRGEGSATQICPDKVCSNPDSGGVAVATPSRMDTKSSAAGVGQVTPRQPDDRLFTWAAMGLAVTILVLILKKLLKSSGQHVFFMDES